ncbi:hypothetical protein NGTWS0302_24100 [Mycolicibacterium cyprinidarum]|uniref:Helix-turn-helix domain-containing protein n=1 Tax=Mycolicibacterium cyprinidarum TaxID=2860311 RepID=A0ABQ4VCL7_9MYCO|nr:hypothetical protein NGTWS0302_24100 [Mycolicibacterium sp. NGTWS0302]GJF17089.1 hypothetical protein NGTWS1702_22980 [Mycolicibacterium sp. NGTWSNA01]
MGDKFNKFAWMNMVFTDKRIKGSQSKVLLWLAWRYAGDSDLVYVKQQTVADRLGVSLRCVKEAFKTGLDLGYLVLSQARRGGHRTSPNRWRLAVPTALPGAESAPSQDEWVQETTRMGAGNDTNGCSFVPEWVQVPPTVTSENTDHKRSLVKVSSKGLEREVSAHGADALTPSDALDENTTIDAELVDPDPDPKPPRYCRDHPHGTPDWCGKCKTARLNYEAWTRRNPGRILDHLRGLGSDRTSKPTDPIRRAIDNCPNRCDEAGRLDDLTDCPLHDNFRRRATS